METHHNTEMPNNHPSQELNTVKDLVDFHLRWSEFRKTAEALAEKDSLSDVERETVNWLIRMADRVGLADLQGSGNA